MKKINIFSIIAALAMISLSACKSYIDDVNINPNVATDAPMHAVLNAALVGTILAQEGEDARLGCMWSQQFTGSDRQYSSLDLYTATSGNFTWDKYYIAAQNAKIATEKADAIGNKAISGAGRIVRALSLGTVVAGWGNAPVTQANDLVAFPNPKYDDQVTAYNTIIASLDKAIADLSSNPKDDNFTGADFFYGGDASKWTKLAYSLKARYLLHTKKYADAIVAADKGITKDSDAFVATHGNSQAQNLNIYYDFIKVNREGYMTADGAYLPTILSTTRNDAKTDEAQRFAFIYKGKSPAFDLNDTGMWAEAASFTIFGAEETNLIIAECANRLGKDVDALKSLNATRAIVKAKLAGSKYDDYEIKDFETGGIAAIVGKTSTEALLYEIMEEKYCSLVGQHEVFNDIKRTKNLIGIKAKGTNAKLPQRFLYPEVEINANSSLPRPLPTLYDATPVNQ